MALRGSGIDRENGFELLDGPIGTAGAREELLAHRVESLLDRGLPLRRHVDRCERRRECECRGSEDTNPRQTMYGPKEALTRHDPSFAGQLQRYRPFDTSPLADLLPPHRVVQPLLIDQLVVARRFRQSGRARARICDRHAGSSTGDAR